VAIFVLGFIVLVHELGHFFAAKLCGIHPNTFAIGFGAPLLRYTHKGTEYRLNMLPFGGYVLLDGEGVDGSQGGFYSQPLKKRVLVVSAGIIANILSAVLIVTFIFNVYGSPRPVVQVRSTIPGTAASDIVRPQDILVSINGNAVTPENADKITGWITERSDRKVDISVKRGTEEVSFEEVPLTRVDGTYILGISYSTLTAFVREAPISLRTLFIEPAVHIFSIGQTILSSLSSLFGQGVNVSESVAGPVGVIQITGQVASVSLVLLLYWTALLSVNIALFNAFPIPALDGGLLAFFLVEAVVGREFWDKHISKPAVKVQRFFLRALLALAFLLVANDIFRLFA